MAAEPCPLSERELEILAGLGDGKLYKQIAEEMEISVSTVRGHLSSVYRKIGVVDRAQAVLLANYCGWLTWEPSLTSPWAGPRNIPGNTSAPEVFDRQVPQDLGEVVAEGEATKRWLAKHNRWLTGVEGDFTIRVGVPRLPRDGRSRREPPHSLAPRRATSPTPLPVSGSAEVQRYAEVGLHVRDNERKEA